VGGDGDRVKISGVQNPHTSIEELPWLKYEKITQKSIFLTIGSFAAILKQFYPRNFGHPITEIYY
jgi:hypothetical protein